MVDIFVVHMYQFIIIILLLLGGIAVLRMAMRRVVAD